MLIGGGMRAKFVFYPIHADLAQPERRLTNWAVQARVSNGRAPPPRREDWNRPGVLSELLPFVQDTFAFARGLPDFPDPLALIQASGTFYEYPMCDRDPLPRWSHGRASLLRRRRASDVSGRQQRREPSGAGRGGAGAASVGRARPAGGAGRLRRGAPANDPRTSCSPTAAAAPSGSST